MKAAILAVGDELLVGQILDTNSAWIGERLDELGCSVVEHRQVGDHHAGIANAVRSMVATHEALVICGGLGPTDDDCTRSAVAAALSLPLTRSAEVESRLNDWFAARGVPMPESNLRQAELPEGASVLHNPFGTAPGFEVHTETCAVFVVPGPPHEMQPMVTAEVLPRITELLGQGSVPGWKTVLKTWGMAEARIGEVLPAALQAAGLYDPNQELPHHPRLGYLARGADGIWVKLFADTEAAGAQMEAVARAVIGPSIFGADDESMESVVLEGCHSRGWTLATAESLTAGMVASRLAGAAGASDVLRGGVVAYATEIKHSMLGVAAERVVSGDCAVQMAIGVAERFGATVGIATTGVAGPAELEDQPPGTVWIGIHIHGMEPIAAELRLPGDRNRVREYATISALDLLRRRMLESNTRSI